MHRFRRLLLVTGLFVVLLALTSPVWLMLGSKLAEPIIRKQLLELANDYLEPRLELGPIDYRFPLSVSTTEARLIAKNEAGEDLEILSVEDLRIVLHRIPIFGGPLVFQELVVENASATFRVTERGEVTGWNTLLRFSGDADGTPEATDSKDVDRPISDLFAIDRIGVQGLDLEYRVAGNPTPMIMKDLAFEVDNRGRSGAKKIDLGRGAGWYEIDTDLKQGELLDLSLKGGIDIDTLDVELTLVKLDLRIDAGNTSVLPPQVQAFIRNRKVEGTIDATLKGEFNLDDFMSSKTRMNVELGRTRFAIDRFLMEIDEATATGRTDNDVFLLEPIVVKALDGTLNGTLRLSDEQTRGKPAREPDAAPPPAGVDGSSRPSAPRRVAKEVDPTRASPETLGAIERALNTDLIPPASLRKVEEFASGFHLFGQFQVAGMEIQALHRIDSDEPHRWAGTVDGAVAGELNLASPLESLQGAGSIGISDGRLSGADAWQALARLMRVVTLNPNQQDRANLEFRVKDERVDFQRFNMLAGAMGVRARGWIGFDRTISFDANAGPLEALQDSAGTIGSILGSLTDRLVKYIIRGRIGDVTVRVAPLGIRFRD